MNERSKRTATEIAKRQRYNTLAEKLRASIEEGGPKLSRAEAKELERIEKDLRPMDDDRRWTVSTLGEVAFFWGVSSAAVRDWFEQGCPRTKTGGRTYEYDLARIARWRHERDMRQNASGTNEAKRELDRSRADLLRLRVDRESGAVVETETVVRELRELYTAARTHLFAARSEFPPEFRDRYERILRESLAGIVADLDARAAAFENENRRTE